MKSFQLSALILMLLLIAACGSDNNNLLILAQTNQNQEYPPGGYPAYDINSTYETAGTLVSYKGGIYASSWWVSPGECPVQGDCACKQGQTAGCFHDGQWVLYDSTKPHEFSYYDYARIQAAYPTQNRCTATDYDQATVISLIDASIASGPLAKAAPAGGYTQQDKEALYREYMLPCRPDLSGILPANVETVKRVMPQAIWDKLAANTYSGDSRLKYFTMVGPDLKYLPWPAENDFKANAYSNFLAAVARYPFFCGEKGYFSSVDEACKRELASLFGHAAQETGGGSIYGSFTWLREYGYVNGSTYFNNGCAAPFNCSRSWARYYGRGPKQLTYYFNYAGFSAAYFNGNYNFLLEWPDMVAYDGTMYFTSALWFVMNHQPPKPSIHDVILGRYRPPQTCNGGADCYGLTYDATTGVKNNFNVTIEIVNGGPECRGENSANSKRRSDGFMEMLTLLNATKTGSELSPVDGCDFIANSGGDFSKVVSIFDDTLNPGLQTWLDMTLTTCKAQSKGGTAMISVTATGIVDACLSKPR